MVSDYVWSSGAFFAGFFFFVLNNIHPFRISLCCESDRIVGKLESKVDNGPVFNRVNMVAWDCSIGVHVQVTDGAAE